MGRAPVPEASVDEEGNSLLGEDEIGPPDELGSAPPARDSVGPKDAHHSHLRARVAPAPYSAHDLGALGFGEDVGHGGRPSFSLGGPRRAPVRRCAPFVAPALVR